MGREPSYGFCCLLLSCVFSLYVHNGYSFLFDNNDNREIFTIITKICDLTHTRRCIENAT